jgi:predicted O-methyltransferase YrrM
VKLRNVLNRDTVYLGINLVRLGVSPMLALRALRITRGAQARGAVQKRSEFCPLIATMLRNPPHTVLEIGRAGGGSLWAFCQAATDDATIVSLDLPEGPFGGVAATTKTLEHLKRFARRGQDLHLIQGNSRDDAVFDGVRAIVPEIDFLFIDGDHSYEGVASDYRRYGTLVAPDGVIGFHDILVHDSSLDCDVHRLWAEIRGDKTEIASPFVTMNGHVWGGIGLLRVRASG